MRALKREYRALAFLLEHDRFGKPLHTFPDHALGQHAARQEARRSLLMIGERNESFFFGSLRPVRRRAICWNIRAARCPAATSTIIWPLLAASPNVRESNGMVAIGAISIVLAKARSSISG